jgi:hypothetical protein
VRFVRRFLSLRIEGNWYVRGKGRERRRFSKRRLCFIYFSLWLSSLYFLSQH